MPMTMATPSIWLENCGGGLRSATNRANSVTGTKGKSTTASFLGRLLETDGVDVVVAGNIGTPLSDYPGRK